MTRVKTLLAAAVVLSGMDLGAVWGSDDTLDRPLPELSAFVKPVNPLMESVLRIINEEPVQNIVPALKALEASHSTLKDQYQKGHNFWTKATLRYKEVCSTKEKKDLYAYCLKTAQQLRRVDHNMHINQDALDMLKDHVATLSNDILAQLSAPDLEYVSFMHPEGISFDDWFSKMVEVQALKKNN